MRQCRPNGNHHAHSYSRHLRLSWAELPRSRAAGHKVTGCDANVYPPMSTQLEALGIELIEGWDCAQLDLRPDHSVVGNVMRRGNPLMEGKS